MGKVKVEDNKKAVEAGKYQFPMGKVEELSKSLIWHTTPMLVVARCACAGTPVRYAFAPHRGSSSPKNAGHFWDPVTPRRRAKGEV